MPWQNRVDPWGALHAVPERGALMGNRGILHDADGSIARKHAHPNWVICTLEPRGAPQTLMAPRHYTQLFFLDEATALAAGHRPCASCRRARFKEFRALWSEVHGTGGAERLRAAAIDKALHAARLENRRKRTFLAAPDDLPPGTLCADGKDPVLIHEDGAFDWSFAGYRRRALPLPDRVAVLTPAPVVALFRAGFRPAIAALPGA
ncbi:hypothetical protein [Roseivivax sp. CAU 1761]